MPLTWTSFSRSPGCIRLTWTPDGWVQPPVRAPGYPSQGALLEPEHAPHGPIPHQRGSRGCRPLGSRPVREAAVFSARCATTLICSTSWLAPPRTVFASRLPANGGHVLADDNVLVALDFADGSRGSILYSALGADSMPKEMLEVMGDGKSATLNNFRTLDLYRGNRKSSRKSGGDKGPQRPISCLG